MSSETINRAYNKDIHRIQQHNNAPANKIFSKVNPAAINLLVPELFFLF